MLGCAGGVLQVLARHLLVPPARVGRPPRAASESANNKGMTMQAGHTTTQLDLTTDGMPHRLSGDTCPALSSHQRDRLIERWRRRMRDEHVSARIFAALIPQMMRAGINDARLSEVTGMVEDELYHARLSAGVVLTLGGAPVIALGALPQVPIHGDVAPLEALLRNTISISCLSETVGVARLEAERSNASGTAFRTTLKRILADEVRHARFGWRLLDQLVPTLPPTLHRRLSAYLVDAFCRLLSRRPADDPLHDAIVRDTVHAIVVPGLEAHGFRAAEAWEKAQRRWRAAA